MKIIYHIEVEWDESDGTRQSPVTTLTMTTGEHQHYPRKFAAFSVDEDRGIKNVGGSLVPTGASSVTITLSNPNKE